MKKIAILKPNGELTGMGTTSDEMLTVLQTACGGYVQSVDLTSTLTMWVNDEGKLNGSEWNECATAIWHAIHGATDTIFGTVVFTGGADEEGETKELTDDDWARLAHVAEAYDRAVKEGFAGV
jgi:hypothetical protein